MFLDLRTLSPLTWSDVPMFAAVVLASAAYRILMTNVVLKKVAQLVKPKFPVKFVHRTFDLIHYASAATLGILALSGRPYRHCYFYALDCKDMFKQAPACVMTDLEKFYYMFFTAYYIVDLGYLWTATDPKMLIMHHGATLSMIGISVILNVQVIGLCVMLLHDIVDVPLYIGKVATYLGFTTVQDVSLVTMAALYTWLRMVNYPMIIFNGFSNGFDEKPFYERLYWFEGALLFVLMFCHVYWFSKIVKAGYRLIKVGKEAIVDNRSESD